MKNKLPVYIEDRELPMDKYNSREDRESSYGYVNILFLASIITTIASIITIVVLGNR